MNIDVFLNIISEFVFNNLLIKLELIKVLDNKKTIKLCLKKGTNSQLLIDFLILNEAYILRYFKGALGQYCHVL